MGCFNDCWNNKETLMKHIFWIIFCLGLLVVSYNGNSMTIEEQLKLFQKRKANKFQRLIDKENRKKEKIKRTAGRKQRKKQRMTRRLEKSTRITETKNKNQKLKASLKSRKNERVMHKLEKPSRIAENKQQKFKKKIAKNNILKITEDKITKSNILNENLASAILDFEKNITDVRSLKYNNPFDNKKMLLRWQKIYNKTYDDIKFIPFKDLNKKKVIAEMRYSSDTINLKKELDYFKALEYNTILVVWDGTNTNELYYQMQLVKDLGFDIWLAYSKKGSLRRSIFIDAEEYKYGLQLLSSISDAFIVGWRRTSLHLNWEKGKWLSYTMQQVRIGNPDIPIIGEVYFGYEGHDDNHFKFTYNIIKNCSALLVVNLGFDNSNIKGIINIIRKKSKMPLIGVVVGEKAYYMTKNFTNKTKKQNRAICDRIENRMKKNGFASTLTLTGDGSDSKKCSSDLCNSMWHKK